MAKRERGKTVKREALRPAAESPAERHDEISERSEAATRESQPKPRLGSETLRGVPQLEPASDPRIAASSTHRKDGAAEQTPAGDPAPGDAKRPPLPSLGSSPDSALGRYQILFELAKGGMGTIYVGRLRGAHGFDRLVAIKRLSMRGASDDDVAAFLREARVSARIDHPNVVKTLELGEHRGQPFIVMDLVQGVSLARLRKRLTKLGQRLDPSLAAWICAQAAAGLHAAHELSVPEGKPLGLVHRDVSPENVLLSFDGRVYVADFGVAKDPHDDKQTHSGVVKGKFAYMSPEQTEARPLDRRSDIFSLGIVLHECLTGERLFQGRSMADTVHRIWSLQPSDPSAARDDVPAELGAITLRCLARDRDARYDSAAALSRALRGMLRQGGRAVDEAELASLLAEVFPSARRALRERIRAALAVAEETPQPTATAQLASDEPLSGAVEPPEDEAPGPGSLTAGVTTGPPLMPRRIAPLWMMAALALVVGGVGAVYLGGDDGESLAAPSDTNAASDDEPVEPEATADTEPEASSAPSASASADGATTDAAPSVSAAGPPKPPPPPRATAQPPPVHTSLPPPKTHKGVPFRDL